MSLNPHFKFPVFHLNRHGAATSDHLYSNGAGKSFVTLLPSVSLHLPGVSKRNPQHPKEGGKGMLEVNYNRYQL